ncbi:MAG: hypothetical protein NDJ75_04960 [Thermoanaerobaculia bacterium]|nr:hypothetical protein [Thermoanaerobaculia bacterium]
MNRKLFRTAAAALAFTIAPLAADSFVKSDDYKEGEEVVGKFLVDADYQLMIDDVERGDADFDWAWVKTADGKMKSKVKALGFQLAAGQTVAIPEVANVHRGMVPPGVVDTVRKNLVGGMEALGLKVVDSGADYTLAAALVDLKQDSTYAFVAMVKPFVELEVRLTARDGEVLARIRDQAHGDNADVASFNFAEELVKFLR